MFGEPAAHLRHAAITRQDTHLLADPAMDATLSTGAPGWPASQELSLAHPGSMQLAQMSTMRGPVDLSRYRRLAEAHGLHGTDQVDKAVELATMSPTSARVAIYSEVTACMNLVRKFREQQTKALWELPERASNQMHVIARYALMAPLPYSWKNEVCARVDMLIKDGHVPKDTNAHPERVSTVMKKAALYASHVRSDVIKTEIRSSLEAPYKNILELTKIIAKAYKGKIELSTEILALIETCGTSLRYA
ncbi:hypothetical protein C8Q79DRAFT_110083 [Trametes meyenii]|nr:hypothetical protein C8Q79DRAFT_110083 [Trametes meyenii]